MRWCHDSTPLLTGRPVSRAQKLDGMGTSRLLTLRPLELDFLLDNTANPFPTTLLLKAGTAVPKRDNRTPRKLSRSVLPLHPSRLALPPSNDDYTLWSVFPSERDLRPPPKSVDDTHSSKPSDPSLNNSRVETSRMC